MIRRILRPKVRKWMYGVTAAGLAVAAWYRVVPPESLVVWVPLAVAFFNVNDKEGGPPAA